MAYVGKNPKFDSVILKDEVAGSVDAPKAGSEKLINRNGTLFIVDSSGVEVEVGSGSAGEINYIDEWNAEIAIANWATYANAVAAATPETGTGGSPTVTWTRQQSTVLRDSWSYKLTKDAANRQGEGVAIPFAIKTQDTNKKLKIQFDFKTNEDAAYTSGLLAVYIYDVTNTTLITPVDTDIPDSQNIFTTSFTSTGSTSYRLIFHVADSGSSAWDAYIDNVIVGPGLASQGAAVGAWETFTPTWENTPPAATTELAIKRRVGDSLEIRGYFESDGAAGSGNLVLTLPDSLTADTTKVDSGTQGRAGSLGFAHFWNDGAASEIMAAYLVDNNSIGFSTPSPSVLAWSSFANDHRLGFELTIPISEWSGKGVVPMLAQDNLSSPQTVSISASDFSNATGLTIDGNVTGQRTGGSLLLTFNAFLQGTGSDASDLTFNLPSEFGSITVSSGSYGSGMLRVDNATSTSRFPARCMFIADGTGGLKFVTTPGGTEKLGNEFGDTGSLFDTMTISAMLPIVEWAGSQNSLVGFSEATANESGLVPKGLIDPDVDSAITFEPRTATPTDPSSSNEGRVYIKGTKLIIQYNDSATVRYKYLELTGTGVTWVHTTSAP